MKSLKISLSENNTCCIFNAGGHYNAAIYKLMDQELGCDFYMGDRIALPLEMMNYNELKGFKKRLKNIFLWGNFYWQANAVQLSFKPYKNYVLTGEPYCISTWFILFLTAIQGKRAYVWTHGWYGNETFIRKVIKKLFFGLSDTILLYGEYARSMMIKEGFSAEKLTCIYNSTDYDRQFEVRQNLAITPIYSSFFNNTYPVLLFIGRIQQAKKLDLLIKAIKALNEQGDFCNLIVVGKEADDTTIGNLIVEYNLGRSVWFFGPCYDERKLGELIYNACLCVSPGYIGLLAMHSLMYGTPVLTHSNFSNQMPEFEAIEPKVTGDFFEEDSIDDLCRKIMPWLNLPLSQRKSVRKKCYSIIDEKYNPHHQIRIIKEALKKA